MTKVERGNFVNVVIAVVIILFSVPVSSVLAVSWEMRMLDFGMAFSTMDFFDIFFRWLDSIPALIVFTIMHCLSLVLSVVYSEHYEYNNDGIVISQETIRSKFSFGVTVVSFVAVITSVSIFLVEIFSTTGNA